MATLDLGNQCVWCQQDTSFGSGRFVNRYTVSTDIDNVEWLTEEQAGDYDTVEGYACSECGGYECDKCGESIATDEDVADKDELGHYHDWCLPKELQWTDPECACPSCSESELYSRLFCENCFDNSCSESEDNC